VAVLGVLAWGCSPSVTTSDIDPMSEQEQSAWSTTGDPVAATSDVRGSSSQDTPTATVVPSGPRYTVQVASFRKELKAQQIADQLLQQGYEAMVAVQAWQDGTEWYRVYVGDFANPAEAQEQLASVKGQFADSFVRLK